MDDRINRQRRRLLAAGGIATLGGCCALRPYPSDSALGEPPAVVEPRLKPYDIQRRQHGPKLAIDAHAHFFNGTDVSVEGYLSRSVAHALEEPLAALLRSIAPFADRLIDILHVPTAAEEYRQLLGHQAQNKALDVKSAATLMRSLALSEKARIANGLFEAFKGTEVERRYRQTEEGRDKPLTEEFIFDSVVGRTDKRVPRILHPVARTKVGGVFEFVGHMLSPRWVNLSDYVESYSTAEGAFGIDGVLHATVDFDHFLCPPKRSSQGDQMRVAALLSLMSGGYMLPLTAYNPWSHVLQGPSYLEQIETHVQSLGAVGVKIYPPMGFYPAGNQALPVNGRQGLPTAAELDRHLSDFFKLCVKLGVPVMAHSGESCGYDGDADRFGGPAGWRELLKEFGQDAPIVNLGHFGGGSQKSGANWSREMAQLMSGDSGRRVYGDLGYWDELTDCDDPRAQRCLVALSRLDSALQAYPGTAARLLYGTDWFMLSKEAQWSSYPEKMLAALERAKQVYPRLAQLNMDALFYGNLVDCYGLGAASASGGKSGNRLRVERFFSARGLPPPDWLPALSG